MEVPGPGIRIMVIGTKNEGCPCSPTNKRDDRCGQSHDRQWLYAGNKGSHHLGGVNHVLSGDQAGADMERVGRQRNDSFGFM